MPNSYIRQQQHDDVIWRYDASKSLDIVTYYFLVLFSLTGLSTLLGMTETVEIQEYIVTSNDNEKTKSHKKNLDVNDGKDDDLCVWSSFNSKVQDIPLKLKNELQSKLDASIVITPSVFEYMQRHIQLHHDNPNFKIYLARKFEYHFRLIDLHVIMLHFISTSYNDDGTTTTNTSDSADEDDNGGDKSKQTLHLVEVYHCKNVILRHFFDVVFSVAGKVMRFVYGTTKPITKHAKLQ